MLAVIRSKFCRKGGFLLQKKKLGLYRNQTSVFCDNKARSLFIAEKFFTFFSSSTVTESGFSFAARSRPFSFANVLGSFCFRCHMCLLSVMSY